MKYTLINFCEFNESAARSYSAIHNEPLSKNLGDITKVDETKLDSFNMICGGSPCFPKGTKIQTINGLVNIEDIQIGDFVLTHKNRYMRVDRIGGEINKEIYVLKAQGFLDTYATSYHPFYVKRTKNAQPEKMPMIDIKKGYYVGSLINTLNENSFCLTDEQCWILGRYVADGHIRHDKRKDRKNSYHYGVILSIGASKIKDVKQHISTYSYNCFEHSASTYRIVINSKELVDLIESLEFGTHAINKKIPQAILNLPINKLQIFLDGYMSGDGCEIKNSGLYSATTISKELALTLCSAIQKVYKIGCRVYFTSTPDTHEIEGRVVNQNDTYIVRFQRDTNKKHRWFLENDIIWYPVKSITTTRNYEDVYNIEVNTDHTYVANNIIVFNCQDFSLVGKQAGSMWKCKDCEHEYNPLTVHYSKRDCCPNCGSKEIDKSRSSLLVEWLRVIRANKPNWGIYENVKNLLGSKFKASFEMFIKELNEYGYNTYYKVLNAKDYGIPQGRERVYLIIIRKDVDNGKFRCPKPFDNGLRLKDIVDDIVDEKYYLTDKQIESIYHWKAYQRPFERICGRNSICPTITARGAGEYHSGMVLYSDKLDVNTNCEKETEAETLAYIKFLKPRVLTERESFRVMGFSDEDYDNVVKAGIRPREQYRQSGNSIAVDVLYCIYKELYKAMPYLFDDLRVSSYFSGIGAFEKGLDKLFEEIN